MGGLLAAGTGMLGSFSTFTGAPIFCVQYSTSGTDMSDTKINLEPPTG